MTDEQTGVTVIGVGSVRVPTSEAAVRLRIQSRQSQPGAALREAGAAVTKAFDVLRTVGVPDADVRTETVSVSPNKVWSEDTEQIRGYDAQQTVRVRVADLALLDRLLGELVEACGEALQIEDVSLSGEAESALAEARQAAVEHAHAKATDYARLTGRALGRAESVVELGGTFRPPPPRGRVMAAALAPMPVAQGEDSSSVSVQIHWSFT